MKHLPKEPSAMDQLIIHSKNNGTAGRRPRRGRRPIFIILLITFFASIIILTIYYSVGIYSIHKSSRSNKSAQTNIYNESDTLITLYQTGAYWRPAMEDTFFWQLDEYPVNFKTPASIVDIDLFETSKDDIAKLHALGKHVVCYINFGTAENYRPDFKDFPVDLLGKEYENWQGERWLDISNFYRFKEILINRIKTAQFKGCDAIEPDNIQSFQEDTGFTISYKDQLNYNLWIASEVHKYGMSIALKNDNRQILDLISIYDFAIIEDCYLEGWCSDYNIFVKNNKAVYMIEYTDNITKSIFLKKDVCPFAREHRFFANLKHRNLDSWQLNCD